MVERNSVRSFSRPNRLNLPCGARTVFRLGLASSAIGELSMGRPFLFPPLDLATTGVVAGCLVTALLASTPVIAQPHGTPVGTWVPHGVAVCSFSGSQLSPAIAADGAGGAFVVWEDLRNGNSDVFLQKIDELGQTALTPGGIPVIATTGNQKAPFVMQDGVGGAYVAWEDYPASGASRIFLQRITAAGAVSTGWPAEGVQLFDQSTASLLRPRLATDGAGGVYVMAQRSTTSIILQLIAPDGTLRPGWSRSGRLVRSGTIARPVVVADGAGNVFISWLEQRVIENSTFISAYLTRYNSGSTETLFQTLEGGSYPSLISDTAAGAIMVTGNSNSLHLSRVSTSSSWATTLGTTVGGPSSSLAPDGSGGAFTVWTPVWASTTTNLLATRHDANGILGSGWNVGGTAFCGSQPSRSEPLLAPDGLGQAIACWQDARFGDLDIFVAVLARNGIQPGTPFNGTIVSGLQEHQANPAIAQTGPGAAIVVWTDNRNTSLLADIYAQRISTDAPTAVVISGLTASVENSSVVLRWHVEQDSPSEMAVWREEEGQQVWNRIGSARVGSGGVYSFVDVNAHPGGHGYRVALVDGSASSDTWINVPQLMSLAIRVPGPNPAVDRIRFEASFAADRPGRVECMDLSGHVRWKQLIPAGGGNQTFQIPSNSWPSGIYWIRAIQGSESRSVRVSLLR